MKASAVILCENACSLGENIGGYDLEKVILAKNDKLSQYTPDAYASALEAVIKAENPKYIIMSHTYQVRDFAPKVAARFEREVVGDCIRYKADGGKLLLTRRIFLGKLDADVNTAATLLILSRSSRAAGSRRFGRKGKCTNRIS